MLFSLWPQLQRAAAGHEGRPSSFPEDATHVFKHELRLRLTLATTEVAATYNGPDARLDPQGLDGMLAWLAAHA